MWYLNVILKERRRGITTFVALYMLDEALFNDNVEAAIIAHRLDSAKDIFRTKVKFPYDNLPDLIKELRPLTTESKSELAFPNGSIIYVDTSIRGGTVQYLHVSELGKIAAVYPKKAKEIISGSIPAVHTGQIAWIESTAEGREGEFYEICKQALKVQESKRPLTQLDWRMFFIPWFNDPDNQLHEEYPLTKADFQYFEHIEHRTGTKLSLEQRRWYAAKKATLREQMKKEYPSTPEEAFEGAAEGSILSDEIYLAREQGRITIVPYTDGIPVDTWWDLGWDDSTSIWFSQDVGNEIHFIYYHEEHLKGLLHYAKVLDELAKDRQWKYGEHTAPHDISVHELGPGKSRWQQAQSLQDPITNQEYCINFQIAKRIETEQDGIQAIRSIFHKCWFDIENTTVRFGEKDVGFPSLEGFRYEWDENLSRFKDTYIHNWASHGAKAFQTFAISHGVTKRFAALDKAFGR